MKYLLLALIFSACSSPILTGKNHRLVWGKPKQVVKLIKYDTTNSGKIDVTFVKNNNDTVTRRNLSEKRFNKLFTKTN